jgi:hypothetical protein
MGTLSQKIHCQASPWATAPPTTGPAMRASPLILPKMPSALPRCAGGNAALTNVSASGKIRAAPAPWTARAAISQPMVGARAQAADATTNSTRPPTNRRRRPKRSPSAVPVISKTAKLRT